MATEQWKTGGLTVEGQLSVFERRLLDRYRAENVFNRFGIQRSIPRRGGKSISFRRMEIIWPTGAAATWGANASAGTFALTEGTPPSATNATWTEVLATVSQYGAYSLISDLAEDQSLDDIMPEYTENYSETMRDVLDLLSRDVLMAGTNVQYASTAASRGAVASGMYLTYSELRESKRTLKNANVKPSGEAGGKYAVLCHPNAMFDLEADTNITNIWQNAGERGMGNQLFDVTFRDLPGGFRIWETTLARIFASAGLSGADVYATLVIGEGAYGQIKLETQPAKLIKKERGSAGTADPLDQVASVGFKCSHAAVILNQNNMVRIEHVTSAKNAA